MPWKGEKEVGEIPGLIHLTSTTTELLMKGFETTKAWLAAKSNPWNTTVKPILALNILMAAWKGV